MAQNITDAIDVRLRELGHSRRWLARQIGVTEQAISGWFNRHRGPSRDLIPRIAIALETSIDRLLGEPEASAPAPKAMSVSDRTGILERIDDRLVQLGRNRAWLASEVGVTAQALSQWYTSGRGPSPRLLPATAQALGLDLGYLVGVEAAPPHWAVEMSETLRRLEAMVNDLHLALASMLPQPASGADASLSSPDAPVSTRARAVNDAQEMSVLLHAADDVVQRSSRQRRAE